VNRLSHLYWSFISFHFSILLLCSFLHYRSFTFVPSVLLPSKRPSLHLIITLFPHFIYHNPLKPSLLLISPFSATNQPTPNSSLLTSSGKGSASNLSLSALYFTHTLCVFMHLLQQYSPGESTVQGVACL
jgi:hypothetical protein